MLCDCGYFLGTLNCFNIFTIAALIGVVWAVTLQLFLNIVCFRALASVAIRVGGGQSKELPRVVQQLSELSTYVTMLCVGATFIPSSPCITDSMGAACWMAHLEPIPVPHGLLIVYLVQISSYVQMIVSERLLARFFGSTVPPGLADIIHHTITLALLGGSLGPYVTMGALVTICREHPVSNLLQARLSMHVNLAC
jgi:hypothetical protein